MAEDTNVLLMFLASQRFEEGKAIRGAFLLTDANTKPLEFRCTNPIRPTALQTVLYGDSLQQHIMVELIGVPLFNSLKDRPSLVLVREPELLGIRPKVAAPVVHVGKEDAIPIKMSPEEQSARLMQSPSGRFEPVVLTTHSRFPGDREQGKAVLADVFSTHDITEPFSRVASALEQVHAQRVGEEK